MTVTLEMLGWDSGLAEAFAALGHPEWYPARIIRETKINFTVIAKGKGDHEVVLSGKVWHDARTDADLPTVGDWVAVDPGQGTDLPVIRAMLPRRNRFSRKAPGRSWLPRAYPQVRRPARRFDQQGRPGGRSSHETRLR